MFKVESLPGNLQFPVVKGELRKPGVAESRRGFLCSDFLIPIVQIS